MSNFLGWLSWLVTARPYLTILILFAITVLLAAGATRRAPPPETAATLPEGSAVAEALVEIDRLFGDSGEAQRGDAPIPWRSAHALRTRPDGRPDK